MRNQFILVSLLLVGVEILLAVYFPLTLFISVLTWPIIILGFMDIYQTKHTIQRNYPLFGRLRYVMEQLRPKMYQYFIESDTDGTPINRVHRSVVYQRAKKERDSTPFGTQLNVYEVGYEWINHSIAALDFNQVDHNLRVTIGGADCKQPYSASIFNVSAMSYGALSKNAVLSLNKGAKSGGFAHNTGEGGLSPYHLENGGDLIWQIGTGYFSCRDKTGNFDPELFAEKVKAPSVKMVEIKLSQGAKPGHGGILPASKNTPEIAKIRNVEVGTDVLSPPFHKAFKTPRELCFFIKKLRELSDGKPIGFKLCLGHKTEFLGICKAMIETKILPDFITVDGGEGGTGAAPLEFSDSVGTPLRDGLSFVNDALVGFGLRDKIRIIASGKVLTGFDIIKLISLGADCCNSARGMMLALGCIQALECNSNNCPTGITTHNPQLMQGLVVGEKYKRIHSFQEETVKSVAEILGAAALTRTTQLRRHHIYRRVSNHEVKRYDEIYPEMVPGALLTKEVPAHFKFYVEHASAEAFAKD